MGRVLGVRRLGRAGWRLGDSSCRPRPPPRWATMDDVFPEDTRSWALLLTEEEEEDFRGIRAGRGLEPRPVAGAGMLLLLEKEKEEESVVFFC